MDSTVLPLIRTSEERSLFLSELDQVENSLFRTNTEKTGDLSALHIRRETLTYWLGVVREGISAKQTLEKLRNDVQTLPTLRLTLAAQPTEEDIDVYSKHVRAKAGNEQIILDIHVDSRVIAGAEVVNGGKITDGSLKKKLQTIDLQKVLSTHFSFFQHSNT